MATWNLIEDGVDFAGLPDNIITQGGLNDIAPIEYNGALYVPGVRVNTSHAQPYPKTVAVYKSTDNGATWAPLDTANAPSILAAAADFDGAHTIWFAYSNPPTSLNAETRLVSFNLATGTFGTAITGGPTSAGFFYTQGRYLAIRILSNGDRWVFYVNGISSVGANSIDAVKYNGAWGTPLVVAAGINRGGGRTRENFIKATAVDHLDRIYILMYRTDSVAPTGATIYNTLLAGVLSGEVIVGSDTHAFWETNGLEDAANGLLCFPLTNEQSSNDVSIIKISTATQTNAVEFVATADVGFGAALPWIVKDATKLYVFFEELNNSTTESALVYYSRLISGGSWTRTLFSDSNTDPLPDPNVSLPWETGSTTATFLADGSLAVTGAYGLITACGVMFFAVGVAAPPHGLSRGMSILTAKQFSELREKGLVGMPTDIYLDQAYPNAGFHVWPIPSLAWIIEFYYWAVLQQFAAVTDTLSIPPAYYDALVFALAVALSPSYRRPVPPSILALAAAAKKDVQDINSQILSGSYHISRTLEGPNEGEPKPAALGPPQPRLLPGAKGE